MTDWLIDWSVRYIHGSLPSSETTGHSTSAWPTHTDRQTDRPQYVWHL